jgi:hypothetical protein
LAAELMMWSIACMAKLNVMNSTIGLEAAHRGARADAGKAIFGDRRVDDALLGPNSSSRPWVTL